MTTANVAQEYVEAIGANPSPSALGAQTLIETIGQNPNPVAWGAQVYMEVIWGTGIGVLTWDGKRVDGTVVG